MTPVVVQLALLLAAAGILGRLAQLLDVVIRKIGGVCRARAKGPTREKGRELVGYPPTPRPRG